MISLPTQPKSSAGRFRPVRAGHDRMDTSGMLERIWDRDATTNRSPADRVERGPMLTHAPARGVRPAWPGAASSARSRTSLRFLREVLVIVAAILLYFGVRGLVETRVPLAHAHARAIVDLERRLGIFVEPDLQRLIVPHDWLVALANWVYIYGHWPVVGLTLVWLHLRHNAVYPQFRNALLISGAIGLVIFALYPVAPPRFLPDLGFWDSVTARSNSYRVLQPPSLVNKYAAMPSLHLGWNLIMGIAWARYATTPAGRVFGWAMPVAMMLAIVVTANHYLLDGIAGGALALVGLAIATAVATYRRSAPTPALRTAPACTYRGGTTPNLRLVDCLRPVAPSRRAAMPLSDHSGGSRCNAVVGHILGCRESARWRSPIAPATNWRPLTAPRRSAPT